MLAYQKNISIFEPTPIQLKKAISGNAKADKKTMIAMIMRLYELVETLEYHDSADAL
jgi:crossover junction endodeoxyribonuclease RuvC